VDKELIEIDGQKLRVVPDGAVNPSLYSSARVRVVHVLKEATTSAGLGEALAGCVREDGTVKWRLWKVTATRSYALQHGLPPWEDISARMLGGSLLASGVVNLNDTIPVGEEGRFTTEWERFSRLAKVRWAKRREKFLDLKPTVIVCGGTYGLMTRLLTECSEQIEPSDGFFLWQGVPCVQALHPSFRARKHRDEYEEFRQRCGRAMGLDIG